MKQDINQFKAPALLGALFALGGVVLAVMLVCKHVFPELCTSAMGCTITDGVDACAALGQNPASKPLGIPLAIPGLFFYVLMTLLFLGLAAAKTESKIKGIISLLLSLLTIGFIIDITLAGINFIKLPVPCMLCAYTYIATIGMVFSGLWIFVLNGKETGGGPEFGEGLKSSIVSIAVAVLATVIVPLVMFMVGSKSAPAGDGHDHHGHDHGHGTSSEYVVDLLAPAEVKERITELNGLKKARVSTRGLTNVEGEKKAYIEVHKFADFRCGHCLNASLILKRALKRWPGRVKVFYRHFPLDGTCNSAVSRPQPGALSCNAAQASLCAPAQGIFGPFYHSVFAFQQSRILTTPENLQSLTEKLGGDWSKMVACMGSSKTQRALEHDVKEAIRLKVESTPTIVVNGRLLTAGTPNPIWFLNLMDALVFEKEGQAAYDEYKKRNPPKAHK